ncbi:MAG: hypothetical protein AAFW83_11740 [Pseudomonadota bacterium]
MTMDFSGTFTTGQVVEFASSAASGITYFSTTEGIVYSVDSMTGALRAEFIFGGELGGLSISPDGQTLAVAQRDARLLANGAETFVIHVVDIPTGSFSLISAGLRNSPNRGEPVPFDVTFTADNELVYTVNDRGVFLEDFMGGQNVTLEGSGDLRFLFNNREIDFTSSENQNFGVITGVISGRLAIFDFTTNTISAEALSARVAGVNGFQFAAISEISDLVVTSGLAVFDFELNLVANLSPLEAFFDFEAVTFNSDGSQFFVLDSETDSVLVFESNTLSIIDIVSLQSDISQSDGNSAISLSPDNELLFVATDGGVEIVDLEFAQTETTMATTQSEVIIGSSADDILNGLGGDPSSFQRGDAIFGLDGNDTILAGVGENQVFGGRGTDTVSYENAPLSVFVELFDGAQSIAQDDTLDSIENIIGSNFRDRLIGSRGDNEIHGDSGDDDIFGNAGQDTLNGDNGNDRLSGDAGFDMISGGEGNDTLDGGAQADNLFGGVGGDSLIGGAGFDRLFADTGDDTLDGGAGPDALFGQLGSDLLNGGTDNDRLFGGAGFDTLNGGAGDDMLSGNFNWDLFVFEDGFGNDVITDFNVANAFERIDLSMVTEITDFQDLTDNHLSTDGNGDAVISVGSDTITLIGVDAGTLTAAEFVF